MININEIINIRNNEGIEDFDGLTSKQMHIIIYDFFNSECPVQIKKNISTEVMDKVWFFRYCEELLKIILRQSQMALTQNGNLKRECVKELYEHKFIISDFIEKGLIKNVNEMDFNPVHNAKLVCLLAGLVKKKHNSLTLTAKGKKQITSEDRNVLFYTILTTYIEKFKWAYNDNFEDEMTGQFALGFTLILFMRYGKVPRGISYYSERYLRAFPTLIEKFFDIKFLPPKMSFELCFKTRWQNVFLEWFNFCIVKNKQEYKVDKNETIETNEIINEVFELKI
jgi:hypothetical protein